MKKTPLGIQPRNTSVKFQYRTLRSRIVVPTRLLIFENFADPPVLITLRSRIVVPTRLLIFENFADPSFLLGPPRLLILPKIISEFSQKSLHFLKLAYSDAVLALFLIFLMKTFKPLTPPPTKFPLYCKITRARVRQQKNISNPPFIQTPPVYYILQKIRTPPLLFGPPYYSGPQSIIAVLVPSLWEYKASLLSFSVKV